MKLLEPSTPIAHPQKEPIKHWAVDERPRERFMAGGRDDLSPAELLAILVGSGSAKEDAVALMRRVLNDCNGSLRLLGRKSIEELCAYNGIGPAKAITILAACELGVRHEREEFRPQLFRSSEDIYHHFYPRLRGRSTEEVHALFLNQQLGFIRSVMISRGGIDASFCDLRVVLREALVCDAVHVALCHNHPSGNKKPSHADDELTQRLAQACRTMQLKLIDHIVLIDGDYYSYADAGKL